MTTPTDGDDPTRRDPESETEGGTAGEGHPPAAEPRHHQSQGSGKQFERGTASGHEPGSEADEPEPEGLGPGASASGKRFARGTDSDGDGVGYEAPGD